MTLLNNPFVTSGYIAPEYFCDRERETEELLRWLVNENNVAIISTRRMGKTGLIQHCFHLKEIKENYYTFLIDIYATKTLREFVFQLGKVILATLKPKGQKAWELFVNSLVSLKAGFSLDMSGMPQWNLELGDIKSPETTLDEIFHYLAVSDKPCIIAIDEFQQVAQYPEKNTEALLRTYVQHCDKAHFIFAGSQRHLMGEMFISPARPFYQSVSILHLSAIDKQKYMEFVQHHFRMAQKNIDMLDAPVSGGEPKAMDGTLSFMVGGKEELVEVYRPLLETMGSSVVRCGEVGAGNTTKLANQIIVACNIQALSEALTLAQKAGGDPELVFQAIRGGLAGSTVMDAKAPMMIAGNDKPGFKIDLHIKDLNNALDCAHTVGAPLPMTAEVQEIMQWMHNHEGGQKDHSAIVQYYEYLTDIRIGR